MRHDLDRLSGGALTEVDIQNARHSSKNERSAPTCVDTGTFEPHLSNDRNPLVDDLHAVHFVVFFFVNFRASGAARGRRRRRREGARTPLQRGRSPLVVSTRAMRTRGSISR
jgi:hypothetical protein